MGVEMTSPLMKYGLVAGRGGVPSMETKFWSNFSAISAMAVSGLLISGMLKALLPSCGHSWGYISLSEDRSTSKSLHCSGYFFGVFHGQGSSNLEHRRSQNSYE